MEKRFRSKIDLWLVVVVVLVIVGQTYALIAVIAGGSRPSAIYTMVAATAFVYLLIGWILVTTVYTVTERELRIRCGPFWKRIRLEDVRGVYETRNPLSSPALSLDRLRIEYGKGRSIMISPADKREFLRAVGREIQKR